MFAVSFPLFAAGAFAFIVFCLVFLAGSIVRWNFGLVVHPAIRFPICRVGQRAQPTNTG
jgi:hypothetical protein